jgi:hypothetical protein
MVELQSAEKVHSASKRQILTDLCLTGTRLGCLLNFGEKPTRRMASRESSAACDESFSVALSLCEKKQERTNWSTGAGDPGF